MTRDPRTSASRPSAVRPPLRRRLAVQIAALLALHSSWGPEVKWLCNPVLSCHSCALAWFACPIGVFVHYAGYRVFPLLAMMRMTQTQPIQRRGSIEFIEM